MDTLKPFTHREKNYYKSGHAQQNLVPSIC